MGGLSSKAPEVVGEHLSKKIAEQLQTDLDEYLTNNPEFPVCLTLLMNQTFADFASSLYQDGRDQYCSWSTDQWTPRHRSFTNSGIKQWSMTSLMSRKVYVINTNTRILLAGWKTRSRSLQNKILFGFQSDICI